MKSPASFIMNLILQSYVQLFINIKVSILKFKSHNMFRPIWPSSGVRIYLMGKLLLSVIGAVTCVRPSDAHACYS
jgi:hypothetical protein